MSWTNKRSTAPAPATGPSTGSSTSSPTRRRPAANAESVRALRISAAASVTSTGYVSGRSGRRAATRGRPDVRAHGGGVPGERGQRRRPRRWLMQRTGGVRTSRRIAAPASATFNRRSSGALIRPGDRVAVMPVWAGMTIDPGPVHRPPAKARSWLTGLACSSGDVIVLRGGAFVQDSYRLAGVVRWTRP